MDNFDLRKFLKESKAIENLNPILKKENLSEGDLRGKIREMILAELGNPEYSDYDEIEDEYADEDTYYGHMKGLEDESGEGELEEAKKKKDEEVEDVETTDIETTDTTEEIPAEDVPAEEAPAAGGLEDVAANMEGTESELMGHLMDALKIAKGMNNEKLETQVGNTLKFFVSEYIGGGEQ
jgi:hypothetical protein